MKVEDLTVSAADISRNFGDWQSKALQNPVTITHHGRPRLILASVEAYRKGGGPLLPLKITAEFRSLLGQMKEAFYALDSTYRVSEANAAAELYFGAPRDALLGNDIRELFPETQDSFAWDVFRRVMATGEAMEFKVNASIRAHPKMNVKAFPYDDGGVGVVFAASDIADEASVLRQRHQALLAALSEQKSLSVAVVNSRGGFEMADEAFCKLTGFAWGQLERLTMAELILTPEQDVFFRTLNEAARFADVKTIEITLITRSGVDRRVRMSMSAAHHDVMADEILILAADLQSALPSPASDEEADTL